MRRQVNEAEKTEEEMLAMTTVKGAWKERNREEESRIRREKRTR